MRKLFGVLALIILVFAVNSFAAVGWVTANEKTVGWDAVTTITGGDPLPEGSTVQYKIYLVNAVTDPDKTNPVEVGTTELLKYTLALNVEGKYLVGVQAIRMVAGEAVSSSTISWSDSPVSCKDEKTFGIRHYFSPSSVTGMFSN